jgi:hypothetical protein
MVQVSPASLARSAAQHRRTLPRETTHAPGYPALTADLADGTAAARSTSLAFEHLYRRSREDL